MRLQHPCIVITILLFSGIGQTVDVEWRDIIPAGISESTAYLADLAVSGEAIHVVYIDNGGELNQVFYRHSLDNGLTFSHSCQIDGDSVEWTSSGKVAASGSTVHVVYKKHVSGYVQPVYRRSLNYGFDWEDPVVLNPEATAPKIACEGDSVYVLYTITEEPRHNRFRRSLNNGQDWSDEFYLQPEASSPDISAADGIVYIVYSGSNGFTQEVFLRRGLERGGQWEDPVQISESPNHHSQIARVSAEAGGRVCVSWMDYENSPMMFDGYIYCRVSNDYGVNWNDISVVSTTYYCAANDVSIRNNTIHVTYRDSRWGWDKNNIYYRQSPDGGNCWLPETVIHEDSTFTETPKIDTSEDLVSIVWDWYLVPIRTEILYRGGVLTTDIAAVEIFAEPKHFQIFDAYPNPFNPCTAISIQLSALSHVSLKVYDVSGRQVADLVNGWRDAGVHEVTFDGSGLPSGVYIYRLRTDDFSSSGKMLLMK